MPGLDETYAWLWKSLETRPDLVRQAPEDTILIPEPARTPPPITRLLPREALGLEIGETIGQGGMGLIRAARQSALDREVAVKTLRDPGRAPRAREELLREAFMTGALEHPHIIPIYALGEDEHGAPMIVMKRIAGTTWRAYFQDPKRFEREEIRDRLGWHLKILLEVCQALSFAHERGIVHRDIKPDNVMIGPHGEVYVLDWGIAVSLNEDDAGRRPLAREVADISGTPRYMAPEMVEADGARIGPATDVYLLGAVLHEIITGAPPHGGRDAQEVLRRAFFAEPKVYPPEVPRELAAIARAAMAREVEDRIPCVAELVRRLELFLEHRGSLELSERTFREALPALEAAVKAGDDDEVHRRFGQCRFAFEYAREAWRDNPQAREGLRRSLTAMARYEIGRGNPQGAAPLIAALDEPAAELSAALARASQEQDARQREFERLKRDLDVTAGSRSRAIGTFIFAGVWLAVPLIVSAFLEAGFVIGQATFVGAYLVYFAMIAAATYINRRRAFSTRVNRTYTYTLIALVPVVMIFRFVGTELGLAPARVVALEICLYGMVAALLGIAVDRRLLVAAVVYLAASLASALHPGWVLELAALANGLALFEIGLMWRRDRPGRPYHVARFERCEVAP